MAPFLDTESALADFLPALAPHSRIAVDTEADSLHCYFEKLCLIQVSVPGGFDWLIDPLAGFPLEPFFAALDGRELIFHGADYDLRLLRRVGFAGPSRIFDTMIAARLCSVTEFSYAALTKKYFGLELTKGSQKANWARRPLLPVMAEYASKDTHYLPELADIFSEELQRLGRWEWFEQSCDRAIRVTENIKERDAEEVWRIAGSGVMRGRLAAILRELWRWRDGEAQRIDKPAFHILHNEQLLAAARTLDEGKPIVFRHLHGGRARRFEEAAERGVAMTEADWPKWVRTPRQRVSKEEEERGKELKRRRDAVATELALDPSLIAPKATIEALAANEAEGATRMMPWQRELLGIEAVALAV